MFAAQKGLCAICGEAPAEHVDHDHATDHATDRVRGLLCFNCNGALGQFRDRRELMLRAIAYLDADRQMIATGPPEMQSGVVLSPYGDPRPVDAGLD